MELINNHYLKLDKFDIFEEIVESLEIGNTYRQEYFENLIKLLLEYEQESNTTVNEIFLPKDDFTEEEILNVPIKRQTLLNAYVYANISGEITLSTEISEFLSKKDILSNELGDISNYILEHSMDINEYFDGESIKFIYNNQEDRIEKEYIFNRGKEKTKKLK